MRSTLMLIDINRHGVASIQTHTHNHIDHYEPGFNFDITELITDVKNKRKLFLKVKQIIIDNSNFNN